MKKDARQSQVDDFVLIIGAMKSGTTSLFDILSQHPEICPSAVKEPDFFIKDRTQDEIDDYRKLWGRRKSGERLALEASVSYAQFPVYPGVPERIKSIGLGEYKFIYMMRDPVKRIESHIRHGVFAGWGKGLEDGIPDDAIEFSKYATQIDRYVNVFGADSIFLLTLEEFAENPDECLFRICQFLGILEHEFVQVREIRNSGEFFNSSKVVGMLSQNRVSRYLIKHFVPISVKTRIRNVLSMSKKRKKSSRDKTIRQQGRWKLTDEEISTIKALLKNDLNNLREKYGVDTGRYWAILKEDKNA